MRSLGALPTAIRAATRRQPLQRAARNPLQPAGARSFSSLPSLRPTLPGSSPHTATRSARLPLHYPTTFGGGGAIEEGAATAADLVPKTSITTHPALAHMQIRCGPRPTMARTSRLIQKRRHGFLSRIRTKAGRKLIARRRAKGRKRLAC